MTISNSSKCRVLILGEKVFGRIKPELEVDYCEIDLLAFPSEYENLQELKFYDIVIIDYAAFDIPDSKASQYQDNFLKQLHAATKIKGTYFCFLHYDEEAPDVDVMYGRIIDRRSLDELEKTQIGLWLLNRYNIYPVNFDSLILNVVTKRSEFAYFQQNWGSSKIIFMTYEEGVIDEAIFEIPDSEVVGFSLNSHKGKLLFLPCLRDFNRPTNLKACLTSLIKALLTYKTRSSLELSDWAIAPIFPYEEELDQRHNELQLQIEQLKSQMESYQVAKQIALMSEYDFQGAVPKFFETQLKLSTFTEEEYKEDFWITDVNSEKIVICETKSKSGGLTKSDIYKLYNHREERMLGENFPALLIVTAHLNAASWKDKMRKIDRQDYKVAADNNILVMRIEDLLYFWNQINEGKKETSELLKLITTEKGWLEVKPDGQHELHK